MVGVARLDYPLVAVMSLPTSEKVRCFRAFIWMLLPFFLAHLRVAARSSHKGV